MASSSHSSHQPKHEVFLSFRGEDTRYNFTSYLLQALEEKGIGVFFDEKKLEMGDELSPTLLGAIAASEIYIIILSKGYASSSWCLIELSEIMEKCNERSKQVMPIFYHVNPSDVRKRGGRFEESFALHQKEKPNELVEKWKAAFTQLGNLKGSHIFGHRSEPEEIKKIVEDVIMKLGRESLSYSEGLVGIHDRKEQIKSLLHIGEEGICVIGIWGMGGIGKTTLAEVVYNELSRMGLFDSFYFLGNVREESQRGGGIFSLRDRLLSNILKEPNFHIDTPRIGSKFTIDRFGRIKVLVVLDDVSDLDQYESLVCSHNQFASGSRIIITSRDKQVLRTCRANEIYEVEELNYVDSLQLFSLYAFRQNHPVVDFEDLSKKVLRYAGGVPIALKVLGSTLYRRNKNHWESILNKLIVSPEQKIQRILKISFDELDNIEKNIFLDIACFLKVCDAKHIVDILETCYAGAFHAGIVNLVDKCLISVDAEYRNIWIHDLHQEMGRDIVRKESEDPGKRSRLWNAKDVCAVLKNEEGTESVEGIILDMFQIDPPQLYPTIFEKMIRLRVLDIYFSKLSCNKLLPVHRYSKSPPFPFRWGYHLWKYLSSKFSPESPIVESLPDALRYLRWDCYPSKSLPSKFNPQNLVELIIVNGKMELLWHGDQDLGNLRKIILSGCKKLKKIPNLLGAIKLESLNCYCCLSLEESPSGNHSTFLKRLRLGFNQHIPKLEFLQHPNFSGCQLEESPSLSVRNPNIVLSETWIQNLPSTLSHINLSYCQNIAILNFGSPSFSCFKSLRTLKIRICKSLKMLLELPLSLEHFDACGCTSIEKVSFVDQPLSEFGSYGGCDLTFTDCFKLNQDSVANILAFVMLRIGSLATQMAEKHLRSRDHKIFDIRKVICCLPGVDISDKFEHQSMASSINLKIDPNNCGGIRFLVFTLCFSIHFNPNLYDTSKMFEFVCEGQLKAKGGTITNFESTFNPCWPISESYLAWILFTKDMVHYDIGYEEASFKFYAVSFFTGNVVDDIKVEKCGVHVSDMEFNNVEKFHPDLTTQRNLGKNKSLAMMVKECLKDRYTFISLH